MSKVYAICEDFCWEETLTKSQIETNVISTSDSIGELENNTIYRGTLTVPTISIPGLTNTDVFSCELQFITTNTEADAKLGIFHPFGDVRVNGLDFIETINTIDYYTLEKNKKYDILIWYDGVEINVVVI